MELSQIESIYQKSGVYPNIGELIKKSNGYYPSQIHRDYYVEDYNFDFLKDFEVIWESNTDLERSKTRKEGYSRYALEKVDYFDGEAYKDGFFVLNKESKLLTNNFVYLLIRSRDLNFSKKESLSCNFSIFYNLKNKDSVKYKDFVLEQFDKKRIFIEEDKAKMSLVCSNNGNLYKRSFTMRENCSIPTELKILHYGEEILEVEDKILNLLSKDQPSLVLFSGEPGTGKTSFIRHIAAQLTKENFLYMPPAIANELGSPSFLPFMLENPGEICVLEDAELALMARDDGNHSSAISNLLGASDGLLGDALKLKFICSFNTELKNIDKALVRKGRLGSLQNFSKLSAKNADRLLEYLGKERQGKELSLAEIYNTEDNGYKKEERRKVGFGV